MPAELASQLLDLTDREIRSAQRMLADQVEAMRRGGADRRAVEARLRTIRENSLVAVLGEEAATGGAPGWPAAAPYASGRRIIGGRRKRA